ncbi:MAG: cyanophycinase [Tannerella sp.]|jgi:cyanophycinase|nr:cyanophycinase [Tannerella sp.]
MNRKIFVLFLATVILSYATVFAQVSPVTINEKSPTRHGPENGSLIIVGGGGRTPKIDEKFLELAGGKDSARIVVIMANVGDSAALAAVNDPKAVENFRKEFGVKDITVLHTKSLVEANSDRFIEPLKKASAVYFLGGRQWRAADSYLNTRTHQAFWDVLHRGGVIMGGSAGASIQGSFLWRGDTRGPHILVGDHTQGLGFLKNSAIDQHLLRRNREFDLVEFIRKSPELIGIGLDERTAVLVQKDTLEVIGESYAVIYDHSTIVGKGNNAHVVNGREDYTASNGPFFFLHEGQKYDLAGRKVIDRPQGRFDGARPEPPPSQSVLHGPDLKSVKAPSHASEAFYRATPITVKDSSSTRHGPENGSLIIAGSGFTPEVWEKFIELAGGKDKANIVVITAAAGDSAALSTRTADRIREQFGVKDVITLHTKSLEVANSEEFVAPLKKATGVFFAGGRQWRTADSYLNTLTHQAFLDVLDRGGVIIGGSAGASIQGSFLWRGDTKGPHILVGDHTQGLGFLKNSVIDQHLLRRNREFDLVDFVRSSPELIGIGLDETASVLVRKDTLEVIGNSYVAIYDYNTIIGQGNSAHVVDSKEVYTTSSGPFFFLHKGQKYDLAGRKVIDVPRRRDASRTETQPPR